MGAVVTLGEEYITNKELGFYVLRGLPLGTYTLEVDVDDDAIVDIAAEITITGGQTT